MTHGARLGVIDFGIMGRINRRARMYLAEILFGLVTGNYARVAEIHFEAGYVPPHHNVGAFATALRAVGEPIRGKRAKDVNITQLLDGLFAITRSFDMAVQPHLLLLQKTMVMVEGVALTLDPHVNMWEVAEPYVRDWVRDEMGPEAILADRLVENVRALSELPRLLRQWVAANPIPGAAPEGPPLPPLPVRRAAAGWSTPWLLLAAGLGAAAVLLAGLMPGTTIRRATAADLPRLAALLVEAVAGGASISFMDGFSHAEALAFWTGKLAAPGMVVLVAHDGNTLLGTVSLATDQPPNQPHRADVQKMIVAAAARRQGIGRQLMAAVETEAKALGRTTLVLDTVPDSAAAILYDQCGWTRIGTIADYALMPDGRLTGTLILAKWL